MRGVGFASLKYLMVLMVFGLVMVLGFGFRFGWGGGFCRGFLFSLGVSGVDCYCVFLLVLYWCVVGCVVFSLFCDVDFLLVY